MKTASALSLLYTLLCIGNIHAFAPLHHKLHNGPSSASALFSTKVERRKFLSQCTSKIASFTTATLTIGTSTTTAFPQVASSALMDNSIQEVKTFKLGEKLTPQDAKKRFLDAMTEIDELIENYTEISKGGGDAVRRYLGTVGVEKKMYGITKVVKELREEADDVVEYTELANEFEAYLYQAEGAAYQSLFVEHSSAKGTPESFLATARKDILNMRKYMGELASLLKLQ